MNILYVYSDNDKEWNCSEIRCMIPARAFRNTKTIGNNKADAMYIAEWGMGTDEAKKKSEWADVIVVQRLFFGNALIAIEYWKARGKKVVADVDDAYDLMPKGVPTYSYWRKGEYKSQQGKFIKLKYLPTVQQKWGAKLCHAVSMPSRVLQRDWDKVVDKTLYIPNYVEADRFLNVPRDPFDKEQIIIGWGGSFSHNDSFRLSGVVDGLIQLMTKFQNVHLHLAGGVPQIAMMFKRRAPLNRVHVLGWTKYDVWPFTLAKFNIGIIPLAGEYDQRRSPIKALEYALMGTPWVGSESPIYDEFAPFGIQVRNSQTQWYQALKEVITNYKEYQDKQKAATELATTWDINKNLDNIVQQYQTVTSRLTKRLEE